jgi:adenylate cyclase
MSFSVSLPHLFPNPLSFFMEASMSFWKELSRRNVVKVGIAYAVAAWLIIHPVDIIFPILHLPEWSITLVTAILIILFPLVLIFSWVYEVTPKGLKKTKDVPLSKSTTQLTGRKLNYIIIGLLVLAVALLIFDNFYLGRRTIETKEVPAVSDMEKTKKTIAVLPFDNLSSDPEQVYFVDGLSEEILNSLAQIPDLTVIAKTSSFSFKGKDKTIQEIAGVLGVENILEGSVRKAGKALRITAQLVKAVDGSHLWSKTYDRELKDIFLIQEDIAKAIAGELKASLGIAKSLKQLGGTDNLEAYELYLVAKGQDDNNRALESIDAAIALDPKFALAWALKAMIRENLSISGPPNRATVELDAGIQAAQSAIKLDPNLAEAYASLCSLRSAKGEWIEAETAFRKVIELSNELSLGYDGTSTYLFAVGYLEKGHDIMEAARLNDPLGAYWNSILSFALLGDRQRTEEEIEHAKALFGDQWGVDGVFTVAHLGSGYSVSSDEISASGIFGDIKINFDSKEDGLAELQRFFYDNKENLQVNSLIFMPLSAVSLGDPQFALDVMERLTTLSPKSVFIVWFPSMKEVRQTSRFKAFVKKIGLVDYWNKFGWPDMCHKLDNGNFECD